MAGLWSLYKSWVDDETLTNEDLNASFQRVLDNSVSDQIEGYSTLNNVNNNSRMDSTTNPYPASVRSYATSVAGEIQRLRYMIKSITGNTNWYEAPTSSLSQVISGVNDSPTSDQIAFYSSFNSYVESAKSGAFIVGSDAAGTIASSSISSSGQKFGSGFLSVSANNSAAAKIVSIRNKVFSFHFWVKSPTATKPILVVPGLRLMVYCNGSGFAYLEMCSFEAAATDQKSKISITGSALITDGSWHSICVSIDGSQSSGSRVARLFVDGAEQGTAITTGTFIIPALSETYAFLNGNYAGFTNGVYSSPTNTAAFSSDTPTGFTKTGSVSVSNGVATMTSAAGVVKYSVTSPVVSFNSATVRTFARIILRNTVALSSTSTTSYGTGFVVNMRHDAADRSVSFVFTDKGVGIVDKTDDDRVFYPLDTSEWHVYDCVVLNSVAYLFIDGLNVASLLLAATDSTAGDLVQFGFINTANSGSFEVALFENFSTSSLGVIQDNNTSLSVDDMVVFEQAQTASSVVLSQLQNASAGSVLKSSKKNFLPNIGPSLITSKDISIPSSSTLLSAKTVLADGDSYYDIFISGTIISAGSVGTISLYMLVGSLQATDDDALLMFASEKQSATVPSGYAQPFCLRSKFRLKNGSTNVSLYGISSGAGTYTLAAQDLRIGVIPIRNGV